jgi:hypothetical protein
VERDESEIDPKTVEKARLRRVPGNSLLKSLVQLLECNCRTPTMMLNAGYAFVNDFIANSSYFYPMAAK